MKRRSVAELRERLTSAWARLLRASEAVDRLLVHPRDDEGRMKAPRKRRRPTAGRPKKTRAEARYDAARAAQLRAGMDYRAALRALRGDNVKGVRTRLLAETAAALKKSPKTVQDLMKPGRRISRKRKRAP